MPVHRVEGFEQALAALAVQIGDALPEPDDGFLDIGLLALHLLELGGKLGLFLLGPEIDAAEPLAVAFELQQPRLDLGQRRKGGARLQAGERQAVLRHAVELLADRARGLAAALARRLEPRLAARARLARLGKPLLHLAQRLLAAFQRRLGDRQIVGGLAALALGGGDRVEQFARAAARSRREDLPARRDRRWSLPRARAASRSARAHWRCASAKAPLPRRSPPCAPGAAATSRSKPSSAASARAAAWRLAAALRLRGFECGFERGERSKREQRRRDSACHAPLPRRARRGCGSAPRPARRAPCWWLAPHARQRRSDRACGRARHAPPWPPGAEPWS